MKLPEIWELTDFQRAQASNRRWGTLAQMLHSNEASVKAKYTPKAEPSPKKEVAEKTTEDELKFLDVCRVIGIHPEAAKHVPDQHRKRVQLFRHLSKNGFSIAKIEAVTGHPYSTIHGYITRGVE